MAPHAKTCFDDWSGVLESAHENGIAWHVLGQVCMTQGAVEQAIGCFELSLKQPSDMTPIDRIQTSLSLATLLQQTGQHAKSRDLLTSINIPSIDQALGFRVAMAKASAAAADGEWHRAEDQFETLEQEQEEALGPTNAATVGTVQKLAATLERLGKLEEARALYRRVYISHQNALGQSHPATLEALDDLAAASRASNAVDEAETLLRQAVEIKTHTLGPDHPGTAHSIGKLAVIDDMRCRYEEARVKYQKALSIMARTLGSAHPLYTTTAENMALSSRLYGQSLYDEDDGFLTDATDSASNRPSNTKGAATVVMRETARRRAFDDAERLYLQVLATQRAAPPSLHPPERLLETGSKLREMYENEAYFAPRRREKVEELMGLLREGRRRGTF
jgi:tetratricopeptide (TPR) repeat protein